MKRQFFFLSIIVFPILVSAQERLFFTVSATGRLSSGWSTSSLPVQFNKSNDCIQLNSGMAVYAGVRGSQPFVMTCRSANNEPVIQLTLFPNPASSISKLISSALLSHEQSLNIAVIDVQGRVLFQISRTPDQLLSGISVDVQRLPAGSYYLRVDGRAFHQVIPFIKMN
ncbi:MAG: T9SS type A sorting domain-containing protein [Methylophilaceae bacterium]